MKVTFLPISICPQTTLPISWHGGLVSAAVRWACTSCPSLSRTMTTPSRAAPVHLLCASVLVTATETCSHAARRSCPSQMASLLELWWPYCSVSLYSSVSLFIEFLWTLWLQLLLTSTYMCVQGGTSYSKFTQSLCNMCSVTHFDNMVQKWLSATEFLRWMDLNQY